MSLDVSWNCPHCNALHTESAETCDTTHLECSECESEVTVDVEAWVTNVDLVRVGPPKDD